MTYVLIVLPLVLSTDFFIFQSTDIIFDAILPEWALAIFCKKFSLIRYEAVEKLKWQSKALLEISESDI